MEIHIPTTHIEYKLKNLLFNHELLVIYLLQNDIAYYILICSFHQPIGFVHVRSFMGIKWMYAFCRQGEQRLGINPLSNITTNN